MCSNSLRGAALTNAVGLLKEELRRAGSLILAAADLTAVPAGGALAVDRDVVGAAQVVAYDRHTCVVLTTLRCFGDNSRGQLGNGTTVTTKEPQTVAIPG